MEKPIVSQSPHMLSNDTTKGIMLDVIIALMPATIAGVLIFGPRSGLLIFVCVVSAMVSEYLTNIVLKKQNTVSDLSSVVTGLLLGLSLPPQLPLWMGALGSAMAIVIVKQMFGGIGQNFANPAITARIVLMVSFPTAMTTWSTPLAWLNTTTDAVTSATPLADPAAYTLEQIFFGFRPGCIGETYGLMIVIGGLYLIVRRIISPVTPIAFIGTMVVFSLIFNIDPLFSIMSGGVLIGAVFMATDYATTPTTWLGKLIFGIGCGIITACIRQFGNLPEGVSFAILLMNILTPHIERLTAPRPFGMGADVS